MRAKLREREAFLKGFAEFCHNIMERAEEKGVKNLEEQEAIRKYLLGALSNKAEMRRIEENILLDDDFAEKLTVAEDQLIDEYLDGALLGAEYKNFNQFFLTLPERKQKLRLIRDLRKYAANSETQTVKQFQKAKSVFFDWRNLITLPSFRLAAVAVLVLLFGFIIWRTVFYQSDVDLGVAQTRDAFRGKRTIESRTTADLEYVPLEDMRGEDAQTISDQNAYKLALIYLLRAAQNPTDSEAHHRLGIFYLADKKIDESLKELNIAVNLSPGNAKIQSDTAAAYLEKSKIAKSAGKEDEVSENLFIALGFVNKALEIDGSLLEALFNKGLILQEMSLVPNQAREAWEEYLKKDSTSSWAKEARENLEELNQQNNPPKDKSQILQDFLDAFHNKDDNRAWEIISQTKEVVTGVMIQQQLVQNFLEASQQSRKEEANEILSAFVYLGKLEKQNAEDAYFAELADYYSNTNQTQRQKLLEAYAKLQQGNQLIRETKFEPSLDVLKRSKELFIAAANVWEAQLAEHRISYSLSRADKITESNEHLLAISKICEQKNYKWLQTMTDIWIAENYYFLGEFSEAILYNQKSLKLARKTSDTYNTHRVLVQLTEVYRTIGDARNALLYAYQISNSFESYQTFPRQKWRDLNYTTEVLQRFKFYDAAVAFGKETIDFALNEVKDDWMITTSHRNLALIYSDLGKFQEAHRQIETNLQISQTLKSEALRKRLSADSTQNLGDLQRMAGDCLNAIENYNKAIQINREIEFSIFEYNARAGKFLCDLTQKNDAGVKEEFTAILQQFDEDRRKLKTEAERIAFFDIKQNVYDAAIDYAFSSVKDKEQAFNYAENSRARSLLKLIHENSETSQPLSQPLALAEIQPRIPPNAQMVYYAVLKDKILIWYISGTKFISIEKTIKEDELEKKVSNYVELLIGKNDKESLSVAAKELYEILITPLETLLEKDKALCIIADKSLFRLPFSALVSPKTNSYLIEDYAILSAPSATIFVEETELAKQKDGVQNEAILSIGNPAFSRAEYLKLEDLPSAKREAEEIASLYDLPRIIFTDKNVVKEQVVNNLNNADVIHFAGHYFTNNTSPFFSKLLLADGDLSVEEIMQVKLSRPRLIILSACETGMERFYNGEGMIGAARAFLASNVPLVVGSQWSVESKATAELMIKFHRYRKLQGLTTIAALRRAQSDMLQDEKSRFQQPFYWAGFLPIGGYANY